MRGYEYETNNDNESDYYSQDEYEEEGSGAGEDEEEPPEGQQEFLEIRERLKEQIRRRAQGATASTAGRSSSTRYRDPPTNFGSFFGPSKPVISQRVLEERKSMKELQNTVPRDKRPSGKDIPSSSKVQAKINGSHPKQKIVNEVKRKAEALKDNRDYSFLLSDDADTLPSPKDKHATRSAFTPKSDHELLNSSVKSRVPISQPTRLPNGHGLNNNTSSTQRHTEVKVEPKRKGAFPNRERAVSLDNGRMDSVVRNGSSLSTTSKASGQKFPSKGPITNKPSMKNVNERPQPSQSLRVQSASYGQRPQQSSQSQRPHQSSQSQRPHQSSQSQRPHQSSQSQRPQQSSQSQRPLLSSQRDRPQQSLQRGKPQQSPQRQRQQQPSQRERPQQSLQSQRLQPLSQSQRLQQSLQRQRPQQFTQLQSSQSNRLQLSQRQRPLSSQGRYAEEKRVQANDRVKPVERQPRPPSKSMSSRPVSANGIRDDRTKKKQMAKRRFDDEIDDEDDPMAMIRSMFGYDPSKYAGRDEDDSDMEADFATIEMEEKRSARIARREDEEELRLIEEEERREQERKRRRR